MLFLRIFHHIVYFYYREILGILSSQKLVLMFVFLPSVWSVTFLDGLKGSGSLFLDDWSVGKNDGILLFECFFLQRIFIFNLFSSREMPHPLQKHAISFLPLIHIVFFRTSSCFTVVGQIIPNKSNCWDEVVGRLRITFFILPSRFLISLKCERIEKRLYRMRLCWKFCPISPKNGCICRRTCSLVKNEKFTKFWIRLHPWLGPFCFFLVNDTKNGFDEANKILFYLIFFEAVFIIFYFCTNFPKWSTFFDHRTLRKHQKM